MKSAGGNGNGKTRGAKGVAKGPAARDVAGGSGRPLDALGTAEVVAAAAAKTKGSKAASAASRTP